MASNILAEIGRILILAEIERQKSRAGDSTTRPGKPEAVKRHKTAGGGILPLPGTEAK
jgi:hypothetical protein